jgi:hypothetical protein
MAGFIVGFDTDDAVTIELQEKWIAQSCIPMAMVGLLKALPGTQLERRLTQEGRMLQDDSSNNFCRPNFVTKMSDTQLLHGYAHMLEKIYSPRAYFKRASRLIELRKDKNPSFKLGPKFALNCLLRSVFYQGVVGKYRQEYWQYLLHILSKTPKQIPQAIRLAIQGEHVIRYTREEVLPRLRHEIEDTMVQRASN